MELHTFTASTTPKCLKKLPFSSSERELIITLVRERPIIEDKRTHAKNIEFKKQAWEELTVAYNAQPYVTARNSMQLRRCWENIKTQRKKELSQESKHMTQTGGGPPQGGSTTSLVDAICPFINLRVPKVIDSNSEILDDLNPLEENVKPDKKDTGFVEIKENKKRKRDTDFFDLQECTDMKNIKNLDDEDENHPKKNYKEIGITPTSNKKFLSEIQARIKRCSINIEQDQALHELRIQREKILIERERNMLNFEKEMHDLQKEKLMIEIELLLKNKNEN